MSASGIRMGRVFVEIGADTSKFFGQIQSLNAAMGKIGKSAANVGSQMMQFGAVLAAPIGLAVRQFAKFDDAIRATAAVTGLLGPEGAAALQMLNDKARELGATTSFTAVEVANLMTELGRAGFKPDEINGMTGAVLDLARATGTDATRSAGIMAATLRQFGLDAGDAAHAADILTYAANSTFNTVDSLGESLKYAGPVAKSLGMSLEDTTAILGVLGNVGIQGSEAGTALRRLSVISAGAGDKLQELFGVTNTDAAGNLKPLVQILDEINTATADMPVAERTKKMAEAFGLLGITSANVLSSSAGGVAALAAGMKDADGVARKTAKAMDAGLGGAIRITLSAIEGTALAIGESLAPSMQKLIEFIGNAAGSLTAFIKDNKAMVVQVAQGVATFVAAGAGLFVFGKSLSMVSTLVGVALGAIGMLGTALSFVAGAAAIVLSPLGLVAIALGTIYANSTEVQGALSSAFAGLSGILAPAAEILANMFGPTLLAGVETLNQIGATASTTFAGIYEAITAGDLIGAMDILWLGLQAGWLRGVAALMNAVDPWIESFQNVFTDLGAGIYIAFDKLYTDSASILNTMGAWVMGFFDNIANGVMATFDNLVAAIKIAWTRVQGFITGATDTEERVQDIKDENAARAEQRAQERPGIEGRTARADTENRQAEKDRQARVDAVGADAQATKDERASRTDARRDERNAAASDAEGALAARTGGAKESRMDKGIAEALIESLSSAKSMDDLTNIGQSISALIERDAISGDMVKKVQDAYNAAAKRIGVATDAGSGITGPKPGGGGAGGSGSTGPDLAAAAKSAEVAGTFSSNLGGMGFGSNLDQMQLDALNKIAKNTENKEEGAVAA
jgi:TP901 family phage tail tape measure protein